MDNLITSDKICVLHTGTEPSLANVILFQDLTLKKCQEAEVVHKARSNWATSIYKNVVLPSTPNIILGYHSKCYAKYTAVPSTAKKAVVQQTESYDTPSAEALPFPAAEPLEEVNLNIGRQSLRSKSTNTDNDKSSHVFPTVCLFCDKQNKKISGKREPLHQIETITFQDVLLKEAQMQDDEKLMRKILGVDLIAKEGRYHNSCRKAYSYQATAISRRLSEQSKNATTDRQRIAAIRKNAFDSTTSYIESHIFNNEEVHRFNTIAEHYTMLLAEFGFDADELAKERKDKFLEKLKTHYGERLQIIRHPTKGVGKVLYKSSLPAEIAIVAIFDLKVNLTVKVKEVAFLLRNEILKNSKVTKLPEVISTKDVIEGECTVPPLLNTFYEHLLTTGGDRHKKGPLSENKKRKTESLAHDAIYAVSNGSIMPTKHLLLALAMKALTGRRKVIEVLNRYGHCVSYSVTQGIETELIFSAMEKSRLLPDGLHPFACLHTGLGFDNFDLFVDTLSGKETLHDTVGIVYQDVLPDTIQPSSTVATRSPSAQLRPAKKRRRALEVENFAIVPYHRSLKLTTQSLTGLEDERRALIAPLYSEAQMLDFTWMLYIYMKVEDTPMWTGWNSKIVENKHPMQVVQYLPQIDASPTIDAVVVLTMEMALCIAAEWEQRYISLSSDLAICKKYFAIQALESPKFDNIFVQLGWFHIELSYYKAVGKFICESGMPYILVESGLLASGSLSGFLEGKNYNRCKRIHELTAIALQTLHFEAFLKSLNGEVTREEIAGFLRSLNYVDGNQSSFFSSVPFEIDELLYKYERYCGLTLVGEHGPTAKYWMIYISLIDVHRKLSRAVRTKDHRLYTQMLPEVIKVFFAFNHHNYARWGTKYHDNLMVMETTHPGITEDFDDGILSIRRTNKPFSSSAIDLTLEQTQNKDAANSSTGVVAVTNNLSARQKFAKGHYIKTTLLSHLFQHCNLRKKEDVSRETYPSRIRKDRKQLNDLLSYINNCRNPFNGNEDELINIGTGKAAPKEVCSFLLNIMKIGKQEYQNFVQSVISDPAAFEKPIKKQVISNFASIGATSKRIRNNQVEVLKMERNYLSTLLVAAIDKKIDMKIVLQYPLSPIPLVFAHPDGSMNKTVKSVLYDILDARLKTAAPRAIDVLIIDGFFFLHLYGSQLPNTFGKIAQFLLIQLCRSTAKRIDVIFDRYISPSIKDQERDRRSSGGRGEIFQISGSHQTKPTNFLKELRGESFKKAFVSYFVNALEDNSLASVLGEKKLYVTEEALCYSFSVIAGKVINTEEPSLRSSHEEADTRMMAHCAILDSPANVVIRTSDSDVLAIAIGNLHQLKDGVQLYIEAGFMGDNSLRYIDINKIGNKLGPQLSKAIPGFHAFTGCDQNPAFSRRGKKGPFGVLEKNVNYQNAFASLGSSECVNEEVTFLLEKFTGEMYPKRGRRVAPSSVNEARLFAFLKEFKPTKKNPLSGIKGIDGSNMPPCHTVLLQQIKRSNYICSFWNKATEVEPVLYRPENSGWILIDGKFSLNWFEGEMSPACLEDIVVSQIEEDEEVHHSSSDDDVDSDSDGD